MRFRDEWGDWRFQMSVRFLLVAATIGAVAFALVPLPSWLGFFQASARSIVGNCSHFWASLRSYATLGELAALGGLTIAGFYVLATMHGRTHGAASPWAALAFVAAGPLLGVVIALTYAAGERRRILISQGANRISDGQIACFVVRMLVLGLMAAAAAAIIVAWLRREEFPGD